MIDFSNCPVIQKWWLHDGEGHQQLLEDNVQYEYACALIAENKWEGYYLTKVGDDTKYPINKYGLPAVNSISPFEEGYRLMTRRLTAALNTKEEEDGYIEE